MHLLVTRPKPDAKQLIEQLENDGHTVTHFALMDIVFRPGISIPQKPYQAVLITSANGARAFIDKPLPAAKAITVGPASTKAARQAGFEIAGQAAGDVTGLIKYVKANLSPRNGPVLYASGAKTTGDLQNELIAAGFKIDRVVLYDAVAATTIAKIPDPAKLDGILLFSPRTAKIWLSLCKTPYEYDRHLFFCLSQNVAMITRQFNINSKNILVAGSPDTESIVELINSTN